MTPHEPEASARGNAPRIDRWEICEASALAGASGSCVTTTQHTTVACRVEHVISSEAARTRRSALPDGKDLRRFVHRFAESVSLGRIKLTLDAHGLAAAEEAEVLRVFERDFTAELVVVVG